MSSDDEEYSTPNNVAETTREPSDHAAHLMTASRLHSNSAPEAPLILGQINTNINDYHSYPMGISRIFWLPDITDWRCQPKEIHCKYSDLYNVARDIFSFKPHGVGVELSFSLGRDVISWRQSETTRETLRKLVIVRQLAPATIGILEGDDLSLNSMNTENDTEMNNEAVEMTLPSMAKDHNFLEMWQGSHTLCATQKESRARNNLMTAMGYISDMEEIVNASWSLFQHDGVAAFQFSEISAFPPPLSAKDLPEDELTHWVSAKSEEQTVIQVKVTTIAHLKAFRSLKIHLTGMGT